MTAKTADSRAPSSLPVGKPVLRAGIALGAFAAAEALIHGLVLPLSLGAFADAALTVVLIVALAIVLAELTRRHHRTVARQAIRHGRGGALATARTAHRHGSTVRAWLVSKAGPRWERREHQPLIFRRTREAEKPAETAPEATSPAPEASITPDDTHGGNPSMAAPSKIKTEHRARRAAAKSGGSVPSEWAAVVAGTADFEPEDETALIEWMNRQTTGMSALAEAMVDLYEHAVAVVGLDPASATMLHDVADAYAQAAETMAAAKAKHLDHYELPREFAADGRLMTHDGRWVTGEGA